MSALAVAIGFAVFMCGVLLGRRQGRDDPILRAVNSRHVMVMRDGRYQCLCGVRGTEDELALHFAVARWR